MRIVLVHGINNQENSVEQIRDQWLGAIREGWDRLGLAHKPMDDVITAYYAKDLAAATNPKAKAVAMGDPAAAGETASIAYQFLKEYQDAAGITDEEIEIVAQLNGVDSQAVGMGPPHEGWVIALATGLEALLPTRGKYVAGIFLKQASVYLENKAVTQKIDTMVKNQIFPAGDTRPAIVLSHSLGTVVTYRLLGAGPPTGFTTPLYVTMGSPLGIEIVQKRLQARTTFPKPPIGRWINAVCKDDFVTLNRSLTAKVMGFPGIEHDGKVPNKGADKHAIVPYLSAPGVARAIHEAL